MLNARKSLLTIFIFILSVIYAQAQVPQLISYQGRVTANDGTPVTDGDYQLVFSIYDVPTGGEPIWTSGEQTVSVVDGLFDYMLGTDSVLSEQLFSSGIDRWLGITIGAEPEGSPRTRLATVPYAFQSSRADTATYAISVAGGGGGWSDDGTVVRLTAIGDSVGIGTAVPQAKLHIEGDLYISTKATIGPGNSNTGSSAFVAGENNSASGDYSSIAGGAYGSAEGTYATISGGGPSDPGNPTISQNMVFDDYGTIGGGGGNRVGDDNDVLDDQSFAAVSGGKENTASSQYSSIGGGLTNSASGYASAIGGGSDNTVTNTHAGVASGYGNAAHGTASSVGGGQSNAAAGNYSRVGGGKTNFAEGQYSVINGGLGNITDGTMAAITGGFQNIVSGNYSAILGGSGNAIEATAPYSYLFGINANLTEDSTFMVDMPHIRFGDEVDGYEFPSGDGNPSQMLATDGSGQLNWTDAGGTWEVIDSVIYTRSHLGISRGGAGNILYGDQAYTMVNLGAACTTGANGSNYTAVTIGGGLGNHAKGNGTTISGGRYNQAILFGAAVGGGFHNNAQDENSFVGGGSYNTADNVHSAICGGTHNFSGGYLSFIGGGRSDTTIGWGSTIGGGKANRTEGWYSGVFSGLYNQTGLVYSDTAVFIGGGMNNVATAKFATIAGGYDNRATGIYGTVSGGIHDTASGSYAVVCGGDANVASSSHSFIGGGQGNQARWGGAAVVGGEWNAATATASFVGGGTGNMAEGDYSAILGGFSNHITSTGDFSFLFGLRSDMTQDSTFMVDMPHIRFGTEADGYEFPTQDGTAGQVMVTNGSGQLNWSYAGGSGNWYVSDSILYTTGYWGLSRGGVGNVFIGDSIQTMVNLGIACTTGVDYWTSLAVTVGGGYGNHAYGTGTTVAGGRHNTALTGHSTVSGGYTNIASGQSAFIGGGSNNTADNVHSIVCGGSNNHADDYLCFIGGGWADTAQGWGSTIGGGHINRTHGRYSGVFCGENNISGQAFADSGSFVGGGYRNAAMAAFSTVAGGQDDTANGMHATIGGGLQNSADGARSMVGGGSGNQAEGGASFVGGGESNHAAAPWSAIVGGVYNYTGGDYSCVLGGYNNDITSTGDYSYLFGINSLLSADSTFMVDMPHIRFGTGVDGYEFPTQDGTAGQVMVTDGSGALSWTSSILAKTDQTDEMKAEIESLKELVGKLVERIEVLESR